MIKTNSKQFYQSISDKALCVLLSNTNLVKVKNICSHTIILVFFPCIMPITNVIHLMECLKQRQQKVQILCLNNTNYIISSWENEKL